MPLNASEIPRSIRFDSPTFAEENERPGRRQSGGSRCSCLRGSIVALLPENGWGLTIDSRPDFIVYIPPLWAIETESATLKNAPNVDGWRMQKGGGSTDTFIIEFVLMDVEDEDNRNVVYQTTFESDEFPGLMQLSLPETTPPLVVGNRYMWFLSLICDRDDRSGDEFMFGWLERANPSPQLVRELAGTSEVDRAILYAEYGLWYDAVATLATLRRSRPDDTEIASLWRSLLFQVGLESLNDTAFVSIPD